MAAIAPLLAAVHVAAVVLWIGGVAFVTTVIFPRLLAAEDPLEQVVLFQGVEHRFAGLARYYLWITGITGALSLYATGSHRYLFKPETAGISLMIVVWVLYFLVLTFEKRVMKALFDKPGKPGTEAIFRALNVFHWVILGLSMAAVTLGVWQGHGGGP